MREKTWSEKLAYGVVGGLLFTWVLKTRAVQRYQPVYLYLLEWLLSPGVPFFSDIPSFSRQYSFFFFFLFFFFSELLDGTLSERRYTCKFSGT